MRHNFKNLKVWQKAMAYTKVVYELTSGFPADEKFGLVAQIRRSAVSIASNIAEGAGRNTDKDFMKFLSHALGSAYELETQLILAKELNFIQEEVFKSNGESINEIQKMLISFIQSLQEKQKSDL